MGLTRWQAHIVDEHGEVQGNAQITFRRSVSGFPLATGLKADRAGSTPKANPFNADSDGYAFVYAPAGRYRITATKGSYTRTWEDVPLGTAQEIDAETLLDVGYPLIFSSVVTSDPPGDGEIHFNNADLSSANLAYISKTSRTGVDIGLRLLELHQGTKTVKSTISIASVNGIDAVSFRVGTVTDEGDYITAALSNHAGSTSLLELNVSFFRELAGNDGADSEVPGPPGEGLDYDEIVADITARDALTGIPAGYRVVVSDIGDGSSAIYELLVVSPQTWSDPIHFGGGSGSGVSLESATLHFLSSSLAST